MGGGLQGLSCGEAFYDNGHIVDSISNSPQIVKSKFFNKVYSGKFRSDDDSILRILEHNHYDVIIPMGDNSVSVLTKIKEDIFVNYGTICACPDKDKFSIVEDKNCFMSFCKEYNVPHPNTVAISEENLESSSLRIGFPALIKPDFSVGARGITRVNNLHELIEKFPKIKNRYGNCTLQEFIDNKDYYYNVMLYRDKNGEILGSTIIKIVRMFPVEAGSSSCCISVENDDLLEICKDCLVKLNWVGIADFDVLQRKDNKEYKIIEINARVPASLRAAYISGVNFPEIIVSDCSGNITPKFVYTPGKILRYLGIDFMWLIKSKRIFGNNPSWFNFWGNNIFYQDIYKEDPSTWCTWLIEGIRKFVRRNKRLRACLKLANIFF